MVEGHVCLLAAQVLEPDSTYVTAKGPVIHARVANMARTLGMVVLLLVEGQTLGRTKTFATVSAFVRRLA